MVLKLETPQRVGSTYSGGLPVLKRVRANEEETDIGIFLTRQFLNDREADLLLSSLSSPTDSICLLARRLTKKAESDDLIAKLIADANGSIEPASGDAPVQEKPKKSRKSTKKTEEPATTTSDVAADAPVQEKPKKSTKKSTKKAEEPVTTTEPVAAADAPLQEKPKKATKKSTKKAEEPTTTTTSSDVAPVADAPVQKPKKATKKSTKKTEEPVAAPTEPVAQDDDSDEIQTRIVTIDGGKQYLIDSEYNLYDISSHEQIGKFDPEANQPILA
jgi:hypothetical protein